MTPVFDQDFSTDDYGADETPAAHEQECVEPLVRATRKIRMISVENNEICPPSGIDRPNRLRKRLGAARQRGHVETMSSRFAFALSEHIARLVQQTLAIFELPQFGRRVDLDVGIGPNATDTAIAKISRGIEDAIAEISLGRWTEARRCARCGKPMGLIRGHVRAMNETPPSVDCEIVQKPLHRRCAKAFDAFVDLSRLFGCVDVNWSFWLQRDNGAQCARRYGA